MMKKNIQVEYDRKGSSSAAPNRFRTAMPVMLLALGLAAQSTCAQELTGTMQQGSQVPAGQEEQAAVTAEGTDERSAGELPENEGQTELPIAAETYDLLLSACEPEEDGANVVVLITTNDELETVYVTSFRNELLVSADGTRMSVGECLQQEGPALVRSALEETFGLQIENEAWVDMAGMARILEQFGGAEADVPEEDLQPVNEQIRRLCERMEKDPEQELLTASGRQRLDGIQSVSYMLLDAERTGGSEDGERVRQIVVSMLRDNVIESPAQLLSIVTTVLAEVHHDLGLFGAAGLVKRMNDSQYYAYETAEIPVSDHYDMTEEGNMDPEMPYTADYLQELFSGMHPENVSSISTEDFPAPWTSAQEESSAAW